MVEYKLIIGIRKDLDMGKGKIAAQASHAAVSCAVWSLKHEKKAYKKWDESGQKKIVIKLNDESEIYKIKTRAEELGLHTHVVIDAGKTQVEPGTATCIGIGPGPEDIIDSITGDYSLL